MKILVFGAGGMIGHKMFLALKKNKHQVFATIRQAKIRYEKYKIFQAEDVFELLDVVNQEKVLQILNHVQPDIVLNCVGITLRKPEIKDFDYSKKINVDFPHFLHSWVELNKSYLIHFSTDCVFSGKDGPYTEESLTSAEDTYGQTKAAGEVIGARALTLRGSMIGRELFTKTEMLEWAISQKNAKVRGYTKAIYSGITTSLMAELIEKLIILPNKLTGLYQVSSEPISKFELLQLIDKYFHLNMTLIEDSSYATSKILNSKKLQKAIGFNCPSWSKMVDDLSCDSFDYGS